MKIVLAVLLITVASALDHYDSYPRQRREDLKVTTRSVASIEIKEARPQRSGTQTILRSRPSSSSLKDDVLRTSARRRSTMARDSSEQPNPWNTETDQDLLRENRAIESTLKNVISRPSTLGELERYQYFSNFPYDGGDALLENADSLTSGEFEGFKETQGQHFLDHNVEEADWSGRDTYEKDSRDELDEQVNVHEFLDEIRRKRLNGELEQYSIGGHRQGRRRKLTSQQQGVLLVETLRKKRNHTSDHRGHSSNLQSGLMDMLGRSMFVIRKMERKCAVAEGVIIDTVRHNGHDIQ